MNGITFFAIPVYGLASGAGTAPDVRRHVASSSIIARERVLHQMVHGSAFSSPMIEQ
jgi:hypothetical protein